MLLQKTIQFKPRLGAGVASLGRAAAKPSPAPSRRRQTQPGHSSAPRFKQEGVPLQAPLGDSLLGTARSEAGWIIFRGGQRKKSRCRNYRNPGNIPSNQTFLKAMADQSRW